MWTYVWRYFIWGRIKETRVSNFIKSYFPTSHFKSYTFVLIDIDIQRFLKNTLNCLKWNLNDWIFLKRY